MQDSNGVSGAPGQPVLYIIVDDDFDNPAHPVSGLVVKHRLPTKEMMKI
ncbi:MAG: hypothetical protein Ct9H90mP23_0050 [Methanobacteriota archaeon]|nr:MAG: hypothetical protein Ct9H90mP23_0050 [Euryarchaeota archaeon]